MDDICAKRQRIDGDVEVGEDEDRISQLPDNILHYILSFLPTKDCAATCVLSTRWKELWISLPINLCLKSSGSSKNGKKWKHDNFTRFVDKVLCRHSSNIEKLNLSFDQYLHNSYVYSWICAAVSRQVQEFRLAISVRKVLQLPHCLCNCKTLTVLRLKVYCHLILPRGIFFPSLKKLHLSCMTFSDEVSFHELLGGVPVLQKLKLSCYLEMESATISIPTLKSLTLDIGTHDRITKASEIQVFAENLTYLRCKSDLTVDLFLDSFPLLTHASVELESLWWTHPESQYLAAKFLNGVRFAKSLRLGQWFLESLYRINSETPNVGFLPTFGDLTLLEVNSAVTRSTSENLEKIFRNSPVLQCLIIKKVEGGKWSENPSPQYFMPFLKTLIVQFFSGKPYEIVFVKFMFKICAGLEKLLLCCSKLLSSQPKNQELLMSELEMIPKASEKCVIKLLLHKP